MVGFEVKDKVCVVTGGAQGLGKNFALDLLRMGARYSLVSNKRHVTLINFSKFGPLFCPY